MRVPLWLWALGFLGGFEMVQAIIKTPRSRHRIVVVKVFNRADVVEGALRSLVRHAREGEEIWVLDEGSSDGTQLIVKRLAPRLGVHLVEPEDVWPDQGITVLELGAEGLEAPRHVQ